MNKNNDNNHHEDNPFAELDLEELEDVKGGAPAGGTGPSVPAPYNPTTAPNLNFPDLGSLMVQMD